MPRGTSGAGLCAPRARAWLGASATAAGFITGLLAPLTPPLLAAAFLAERPGASTWIAAGLRVFGLALVSGLEVGEIGPSLLLLGGAACFALHIVFTRRFVHDDDPMRLVRQQMLVCSVSFAGVALATEPLSVPGRTSVWVAVAVTGVLGTALAYTLQTRAQRRTTATRTSLALASEPVFAAVFAALLAGERLGLMGFAGLRGNSGGDCRRGRVPRRPKGQLAEVTTCKRWSSLPASCQRVSALSHALTVQAVDWR